MRAEAPTTDANVAPARAGADGAGPHYAFPALEAKARGMRWCIGCGRALDFEAQISAMFCGASCRVKAGRMRAARGVGAAHRPPSFLLPGGRLDWHAMEQARAMAFELIHDAPIAAADQIFRWRGKRR